MASSSWLRSVSGGAHPQQMRWALRGQNTKRGGEWRGRVGVGIRGMEGGKEASEIRRTMIKYKGTERREKQLSEMIEKKVGEAQQICEGDSSADECRVAWDEVEEVSQAMAHLRHKLLLEKVDPLHYYCQDNPDTDECRVYDP